MGARAASRRCPSFEWASRREASVETNDDDDDEDDCAIRRRKSSALTSISPLSGRVRSRAGKRERARAAKGQKERDSQPEEEDEL